ncbi:MAG: hypothetical protein FJ318_10035 [SAR202 cluster bacterium]|nr:hypothetical protein [SAR202 cluster bacterium]
MAFVFVLTRRLVEGSWGYQRMRRNPAPFLRIYQGVVLGAVELLGGFMLGVLLPPFFAFLVATEGFVEQDYVRLALAVGLTVLGWWGIVLGAGHLYIGLRGFDAWDGLMRALGGEAGDGSRTAER